MTICADSTFSLVSPCVNNHQFTVINPLKLGILASGSGSNFEAVAQAIEDKQLNAQIQVLIYNNPSAKVAHKAANRGIETVLLNHREYKIVPYSTKKLSIHCGVMM